MDGTQERASLDAVAATLQAKLTPDAMEQIRSVYAFYFKDLDQTYTLDARGREGRGWLSGAPETHHLHSDFAVTITSEDFAKLVAGTLHPMAGMATGRMKLQGNIKEALKLDRLLKS